jgi:ubiquinone/menaquinone biosynthesis C-methylase UbiE
MEPAMYERIFSVQNKHWWHLSRMRFLDVLLRSIPRRGRVLDVGCGPGSMLHYLGKYGEVTGVDSYLPALEMARTNFDGQLLEGDIARLPFPDAHFSLVAACEVLYHRNVTDLLQAVGECARVLEPGGHFLVVDSAYSACYSAHDRAAHGARRFDKGTLVKLFQAAGLEVVHATYAYSLLLPVVWLVRRGKELLKLEEKPGAEIHETWGPLNSMLVGCFSLEAHIAGRWGLPFGLSVQILGRKKCVKQLRDDG